ncbi:MAG TPA: T9SS type A sorting domain-containing protein, partial [Bacteroidales bacterium]|nr:T9SS type A sorting domain-containing protein [Bacteroidales bacterium]
PLSQKNSDNPNIVTILELGTSANVLGYSSGTRPMVWADDDLNCVINLHRAGPGATPSNLSGYYAMDLGLNLGATQTDWTNQIIVSSAIYTASPYWYDASRYPCAAIYNPGGGTNLADAYCSFFGPNFCNKVVSGFGGYTSGAANLVNFTDTNRTLRWYAPPPYTYIPDGFNVDVNGIAHMVDGDNNVESGSVVYMGNLIYGRGIWNATTHQHDYTYTTVPFPTKNGNYNLADNKIASSPDGNTLWMTTLGDADNGTPLIDSTFFPTVRRSTDGGLTWGDRINIQLDGPNGLDGVKNAYSDYFISTLFNPPLPTRDEIPYTTAFDHSVAVDKWGNLHIGVAIGFAAGGYAISYRVDSLINVFDVYTTDDGATWHAVRVGSLKTFRGTWGDYSSDNRVYISRNKAGDKMFFTWNDTHIDNEVDNQNPDVWARGFDLVTNMLTNDAGADAPVNVTFLSDITQEAYWQCTSPIVFTDDNKYTLPICTQWFGDPTADSKFKYIPDFSFTDADFTVPVPNPPFPIGMEKRDLASISINPNPVKDYAKVNVSLKSNSDMTLSVTNLVGQQVMSQNEGMVNAGSHTFTLDASKLNAGVYFVTVLVNGQKYTEKMIVE